MTVNAAYRCTHGTVRTLVTMGILGISYNGYIVMDSHSCDRGSSPGQCKHIYVML